MVLRVTVLMMALTIMVQTFGTKWYKMVQNKWLCMANLVISISDFAALNLKLDSKSFAFFLEVSQLHVALIRIGLNRFQLEKPHHEQK